jgi:hypothetical protein
MPEMDAQELLDLSLGKSRDVISGVITARIRN